MNRKWALSAATLLIIGSTLSGCYDERPGRHRPPHHDRDRPGDGRPGDGRPGDGRPDRPDRYR